MYMRFGFTGSRSGLPEWKKEQIEKEFDKHPKIEVFHGDCIGADTDFHNLCLEYRQRTNKELIIYIHPPDNNSMRGNNTPDYIATPKQYLKRNRDIVDNCNVLIACPFDANREEVRSGTWATIRYARNNNIPVILL